MAMQANEIEALIKAALPDASVKIDDLAGDGDHYAATVVSEQFRGLSRVRQHQKHWVDVLWSGTLVLVLRSCWGFLCYAPSLKPAGPPRDPA